MFIIIYKKILDGMRTNKATFFIKRDGSLTFSRSNLQYGIFPFVFLYNKINESLSVSFSLIIRRDCNVDVGIIEQNIKTPEGKKIRKQLEVDFIVNKDDKRLYIQSALSITEPEKRIQEIASLVRIPDSFGKIVVTRDHIRPWRDENGILYVGVEQFLLDDTILQI